MPDPIEDVKGRVKEAAGVITGSKSLEREGEAQRDKAAAKEDAARAEERADQARERAAAAEARERSHQ